MYTRLRRRFEQELTSELSRLAQDEVSLDDMEDTDSVPAEIAMIQIEDKISTLEELEKLPFEI